MFKSKSGFAVVDASITLFIAAVAFLTASKVFSVVQASHAHYLEVRRAGVILLREISDARAARFQELKPSISSDENVTVTRTVEIVAPGLARVTITAEISTPGWPRRESVRAVIFRRDVPR